MRGSGNLASTLRYKTHGHSPRPNYYSKQGDNDDRRLPPPPDVLRHRLLRHGSRAGEWPFP
ncbi:hypothetical protein DF032_19115 [Burkholderia seminalis]|nr:hypothetical protein DF032_19115 [Burkholderia seminalis]